MRPADVLATPVVETREKHLLAAYDAAPKSGLALEFGVFKGSSLRRLAEHDPKRLFVGFDSFRGLPTAWDTGDRGAKHPVGHFSTNGQLPANLPPNVVLVAAPFEASLRRLWASVKTPPVDFVHIDCDLGGSADLALHAILPSLSIGTVLVFDELIGAACNYTTWESHEWAALQRLEQMLSGVSLRPRPLLHTPGGIQASFQIDSEVPNALVSGLIGHAG